MQVQNPQYKYYKKLEREFSQVPISHLDPSSVEYAKRYVQKVLA